jgi:tight adherence protein B
VRWTDAAPWIVSGLLALATLLWRGPRLVVPSGSVGRSRRTPAATLRAWWARRPGVQERARAALVGQTCQTLDLCVAGLRAGLDLPAVLTFATDEVGASVQVCDLLDGRGGSRPIWVVGQAQQLSASVGVPLADAWEAAAALIREREMVRRKVAVSLAGPRATMRVLTLLPLAGPVVGVVFGIDPWRLFAGSPITLAALFLGLGLVGVGRWWCRRLVGRLGLSRGGVMPGEVA